MLSQLDVSVQNRLYLGRKEDPLVVCYKFR